MTGFERIHAVLNGQLPDRVPTMLDCFMPAVREMGITMEDYRSNPQNIAQTHLRFARKYGLDGVLMDIDTCLEANAMGVPTDYPVHAPGRVTGPLSEDIEACIEAMSPDKLLRSRQVNNMLEAVRLAKKEAGGEIYIRGNCDQMAFSLAMLSYGMMNFLEALMDEDMEDQIFLLLDRAYDVHLEYCKLMMQADADCVSFGDSPCGPDMISPAFYRKFAMPYHRRLKNDLDRLGIQTICHICGNLDRIIEDVAEIGFAGVEVDYKTNIPRAAEIFRGKSAFFGPIDPSGVFCLGTPQDVAAETERVLDIFQGRGLVISGGCSLPEETGEENLRAFQQTAARYRL